MRCLHPSVIRLADGGTMVTNCNRCMACRINKTEEWSTKLLFEAEKWSKNCFITLTYDDDFLPENGSLVKKHIQDFNKRVRKHYFGNSTSDYKFYICGEYGPGTFRPHYHGAIFGVDFDFEEWKEYKPGHYYSPTLLKLWPFGFNEVGFLNKTTMNYVTGYIQKKLFGHGAVEYSERGVIPPFQLFSRGFGLDFAETHKKQLVDNMFVSVRGKKMPIPRYYVNKLGMREVDPEIGSSIIQAKAILEERRRREMYPDLDDWEFEKLQHSIRVQREIDLKAKESLRPSRGKI